MGEDAGEEGIAARPAANGLALVLAVGGALGDQPVDLGDVQRREGAGEAGRGAGGQHQFGQRRHLAATGFGRAGAEADRQAVLAFVDFARGVQSQFFRVAAKIGGGDEQIERVAGGEQRRAGRAGGHHVERLGDHPREADAAERRLEPARADEAAELGAHFGAGFGGDAGRDDIARLAEQRADQRHCPDLQRAGDDARIGIEQRIDVGAFQPQFGQRIEALARMDRLGEEHAVDPAGAGAADDVGQHVQRRSAGGGDAAQQI